MSIEAINWAFNLAVPSSAKFVATVLGNYADSKGICWPSFVTISQKTSLSRRSVIQQINYLEKFGFITRIRKSDTGVNVYQLHFNVVNTAAILDKNNTNTSELYSPPSEPRSLVNGNEVVNVIHQGSERTSLPSEPNSPPLVNVVHPEYKYINHQEPSLNLKEGKSKKRRFCLSEDFSVTEKHRDYANKHLCPSPDNEVEKFKNYWIGKGESKADWDRAFYNWLLNAKEFNKQKTTGVSNVSTQRQGKSKIDMLYKVCSGAFDGTKYERKQELKIINPEN